MKAKQQADAKALKEARDKGTFQCILHLFQVLS
jgi:hypothetical protein